MAIPPGKCVDRRTKIAYNCKNVRCAYTSIPHGSALWAIFPKFCKGGFRMLLALDVGNTNTTIGVFEQETLRFESRMATDRRKMSDQYAVELLDILRLHG